MLKWESVAKIEETYQYTSSFGIPGWCGPWDNSRGTKSIVSLREAKEGGALEEAAGGTDARVVVDRQWRVLG